MKELFLICALALPGNVYSKPSAITHAAPTWDFGKDDIRVIRFLRDWPNGNTGSRPNSWVLIYGRHPLWVHKLRDDHVNVVGMFRQHMKWRGYVQGDPLKTPFRDKQFQVYIYDWFPEKPWELVQEASRIIDKFGFFLYRFTKNGEMKNALMFSGWERFSLDFHEFTIWWRPKNYDHIELTHTIIVRSA